MSPAPVRRIVAILPYPVGLGLLLGCGTIAAHHPAKTLDQGPQPAARISLGSHGLPARFFAPGFDTRCSSQVIGYRFVVWLDPKDIAVGFNTSPNCRELPQAPVDGVLRILVFDINGLLKSSRDLPYLADGNGELVADGEAMPGPGGTLLVRIESVNLDQTGSSESKSGVRLLDATLKDVARIDGFLEQTTFAGHALVFREGYAVPGSDRYSIRKSPLADQVEHRQVDWPTGTMDRKLGDHGFAYMLCRQELRPGEFTSSNIVHANAKFRCAMNAVGEQDVTWSYPLRDGETAALVGLLQDGSVVGQVHTPGNKTRRLVIWTDPTHQEALPWLPSAFQGEVSSATPDFSRYASFATADDRPCNPITRVLGQACDQGGDGRWFIFDRNRQAPVVNRAFPKNGRAALSPDGSHYASFEANELRIFSLDPPK